jgi:tetratricopeptide (TPR) repeat protein
LCKIITFLGESKVGLNAMSRLRISWLLLASLCIPLLSRAQSPESPHAVSVRELSIPPKAHHAFQKGVERLAKDDAAGSLPNFQRAVADFKTYYEAYFEIGVAELKLWRLADSEQALRKSIELSGGKYADPLFALGAVLTYQGKFTEGEGILREALDLNPTSWAGHYCLGWALFALDRLQDAEKSLHEALRWKSDSPETHLLLADIHHRQRDYPALLRDLDEYRKLEPDSPINDKVRDRRDEAEKAILKSQSPSSRVQPQP